MKQLNDLKFETVARSLEWLESLEPVEIIEVLSDYPGERNSRQDCVLARYCRETTGQMVRVHLTKVQINLDEPLSKPLQLIPLGKKLRSFRVKFDDGDYPELEK